MPKSEGQKLKLLYLADLLRRETDEDHALSMSDILSRLEELGVVSPVIAVSCQYKRPTTFNDLVDTTVTVQEYRGARLRVGYEMRKADGTLVLTGDSSHCFLDREGRFLRLSREIPELDQTLRELAGASQVPAG